MTAVDYKSALLDADVLDSGPSPWVGHIPFAFWIIKQLQPHILVELGVYYGHSYFSFCQAVFDNGLSTKCYAVDTWQGDEHAGFYGEEVFAAINAHNQRMYHAFSQLLRMPFDEAVTYFSDSTIDLLHIDGLHTYEAVRHDFEMWLPKLSSRGVVLFHDISVRERGFGVWRLWEELSASYPHIEFEHSCGLGVLFVGDTQPTGIMKLLEEWSTPDGRHFIKRFFVKLGQLVSLEYQTNSLTKTVAERDGQIAGLNQALSERDGQIAGLKQAVVEREGQIAGLKQAVVEREGQIAGLKQAVAERDGQIAGLNQALIERNGQIANFEAQLAAIYASRSWRITAPVRAVGTKLRQMKERGRAAKTISHFVLNNGPRAGYRLFKERYLLLSSDAFDCDYYRSQYPDVAAAQIDPALHYLLYGASEGRNPNPLFDTCWYLQHYPDVVKAGINPLVHYLRFGMKEGRLLHKDNSDNRIANLNKVNITIKIPPIKNIDINKYNFFFFDVFDTAIIRLFQSPTDVFRYISFKKRKPDFYVRRIKQEKRTRKLHEDRKEINILDIYKDFTDIEKDEEIATECKFCVTNPEVYLFYLKLIDVGKKIFFISDIYLDKLTVTKILKDNGYSQYEDIFVSSDDDLIKGDGSRFDWLRKNYPETVGTSIHIGDNIIADFEQPKAFGYDAFHYIDSETYYKTDSFINTKIYFLNSKNSLGISFILAIFRYWKASFYNQSPSYWRQFGFLYGGALVSSFCYFIYNHLLQKNLACNSIFFLGRDGHIMSKVYRLFFNDYDNIQLLASRRCMAFPSLKSLDYTDDAKELLHFTSPLDITGPEDILEKFGYPDLHKLKRDLENIGRDPSKWTEKNIYNCILRNKDLIMEKVNVERKTLFDYLSEMKFFEQDDIVIIDVGWGGTIQNSLLKLLNIYGYNNKSLYGIYLGVNHIALHKDKMKGYLFEGDQTGYSDYMELIELLTSSPQDPINRIKYVDGQYVPISGRVTIYEKKRQRVATEIQKGIIDFAKIINERGIDIGFIQPNDFRLLFDSLRDYPSDEDMRQLGQLKHARTVGNNYSCSILNFKNSFGNIIRHDIKIVTIYINQDMYDAFFINNHYVNCYDLVGINNLGLNRGLSIIYNEIVEEYLNKCCWLFFVHEDFQIKSNLTNIANLDPSCIYGAFGIRLEQEYIPVGYGKHMCSNKDGTEAMEVGLELTTPVRVQTLDCQSILIHTSLLKKHPLLRFDENLTFDLYVEDFCINAQERYGIDIKVFPLKFQHYSFGNTTERYYEGLKYLAKKYPTVGVPGSCSFVGGKAYELEKKFKYNIHANKNNMSATS